MKTMTKTMSLAIALLWMWQHPAFSADDMKEKPTKQALQKLYSDFLKEEGFIPELDSDGDVRFKYEGKVYYIDATNSAKDPEFFRIVFPFFWKIESETERIRAFATCADVNASMKVAKVFITRDNTSISIELLLAKPGDFKPVFKRSMTILGDARNKFVTKMRELNQQ